MPVYVRFAQENGSARARAHLHGLSLKSDSVLVLSVFSLMCTDFAAYDPKEVRPSIQINKDESCVFRPNHLSPKSIEISPRMTPKISITISKRFLLVPPTSTPFAYSLTVVRNSTKQTYLDAHLQISGKQTELAEKGNQPAFRIITERRCVKETPQRILFY